MNKPGGILFEIPYIDIIANIINSVIVFKMNAFYIKMAIISTNRENHPTNYELNNSIIIKRFLFEFINRFFHYFYLAFVAHNFQKTQELL